MASGLELIQKRITEKAKAEAARIVREAMKEKESTLASARQEGEKLASDILASAKAEAEIRYEEKLGSIRTELRRRLLTKREELIDQAWERAVEKLRSYVKSEEYRSHLKELVIETAKLVEGDSFKVYANSADTSFIEASRPEIERALREEGDIKRMILGDSVDCIGGVRVSDPEGSVVLDRTYDSKIRRLKPLLRSKIAAILTGGLER